MAMVFCRIADGGARPMGIHVVDLAGDTARVEREVGMTLAALGPSGLERSHDRRPHRR